jgi:hypothetical protein
MHLNLLILRRADESLLTRPRRNMIINPNSPPPSSSGNPEFCPLSPPRPVAKKLADCWGTRPRCSRVTLNELQTARTRPSRRRSVRVLCVVRRWMRDPAVGELLCLATSGLRMVKSIRTPTQDGCISATTESCGDLAEFIRLVCLSVWEGWNCEFRGTRWESGASGVGAGGLPRQVWKAAHWADLRLFTEKREASEEDRRAWQEGIPLVFEQRSAWCRQRNGAHLRHPFAEVQVEAVAGNARSSSRLGWWPRGLGGPPAARHPGVVANGRKCTKRPCVAATCDRLRDGDSSRVHQGAKRSWVNADCGRSQQREDRGDRPDPELRRTCRRRHRCESAPRMQRGETPPCMSDSPSECRDLEISQVQNCARRCWDPPPPVPAIAAAGGGPLSCIDGAAFICAAACIGA